MRVEKADPMRYTYFVIVNSCFAVCFTYKDKEVDLWIIRLYYRF